VIDSNTYPQNVHRMRGSIGRKWDDLASFGHIELIFFNDLGDKRLAPKAEVTGSNPVERANNFYSLHDNSWSSGWGYVRIILSEVAPLV